MASLSLAEPLHPPITNPINFTREPTRHLCAPHDITQDVDRQLVYVFPFLCCAFGRRRWRSLAFKGLTRAAGSLRCAVLAGPAEQARQAAVPGSGQCRKDDAAAHAEGTSTTTPGRWMGDDWGCRGKDGLSSGHGVSVLEMEADMDTRRTTGLLFSSPLFTRVSWPRWHLAAMSLPSRRPKG